MTALALLKACARRVGLRRFWRRAAPSNTIRRDADPATIDSDVRYGMQCGRLYHQRLRELGVEPEGAVVLEIGPGHAFGGMAYLAAHGARPIVADRWLAPWQEGYHPAYYARLVALLAEEPDARHDGLDGSAGHPAAIRLVHQPAEDLGAIADASLDAVVSNAVFEHVADATSAAATLFRKTKPGGVGIHQIDFRDHRDFARPLEHLPLPPKEFRRLTDSANTEYGAQLRQGEYAAAFAAAGFEAVRYDSNSRADEAYIRDLLPRLRAAPASPYRDWPEEELFDLGGLFFLRRPL